MKPFDYYSKSSITYPVKQDYTTYYVYDKGEVIGKFAAWERSKAGLKELYPNAVIQDILDESAFKVHQAQYNEKTQKLAQEFEDDLFDEFGVSDNPKRYKCFSLAWENGHAHGYSEVYNHFSDYVELIKD
jgi:hypothetical protein